MKTFQNLFIIITCMFLISCTQERKIRPISKPILVFHAANKVMEENHVLMPIAGSNETIYVGHPILYARQDYFSDVLSMEAGTGWNDNPELIITLTEEARHRLALATQQLVGKYIAILNDDKVIMVAIVQEQLDVNLFVISGSLSMEEIDDIIRKFRH